MIERRNTTYWVYGIQLDTEYSFLLPLVSEVERRDLPSLYFGLLSSAGAHGALGQISQVGTDTSPLHKTEQGYKVRTNVAEFLLQPDRIICHLLDGARPHEAELWLLGTVLAFWQEWPGHGVLHASAVMVDQRAVGFMGYNQSGKTSLAASFLQAGYPLLTDDVLALQMVDGLCMAQAGYPQMRMWPEQAEHFVGDYEKLAKVSEQTSKRRVPVSALGSFCDQPQPLAALYLPERQEAAEWGTRIEIEPLKVTSALPRLVEHAFAARWLHAPEQRRQRLAFYAPLARSIPIRRVHYPHGFEHLPRLREAILADLETILG